MTQARVFATQKNPLTTLHPVLSCCVSQLLAFTVAVLTTQPLPDYLSCLCFFI